MDVSIETASPIVAVPQGDDAADSEMTADVGIWAMVKGVSESSAVGATWSGVVGE